MLPCSKDMFVGEGNVMHAPPFRIYYKKQTYNQNLTANRESDYLQGS